MSNLEIPEFRISSEISICQDSFLDNIPERIINVEIQIIHNNDNSINHQTIKSKNKKASRKKYVYTSSTLEKSQWPKLKISGTYIRESRYSKNNKDIENDQDDVSRSNTNKIVLTTSLTQSLQRLSKEEEQKIANQSPRTRPLKYPCFTPYATANRNLVIPTSDVPIKELPHPFQSKTVNELSFYKYQVNDVDDYYLRFNGYSANDPFTGISNKNHNSHIYTSSMNQSSENYTQTIKKQKKDQNSKKSFSSVPKSAKTQKTIDVPDSSKTAVFDTTSPYFDYDSVAKTILPQPSVPVIFRTEMRKKIKKESLNSRPYFTTCQEPLSKRPSTLNEMRSTSSHII